MHAPSFSISKTMALCNSESPTHFRIQQSQPLLFLWLTIFVFVPFPFANSIVLNYSNFQANDLTIHYQGDAFVANEAIELTNALDTDSFKHVGRASYAHPIHLWDSKTGNLTHFNTSFSFTITPTNSTYHGDGLAFFLSPYNASIPNNTYGGLLGLFNSSDPTKDQIVAVEFDTKQDSWDPPQDHFGFDVNSIASIYSTELFDSLASGVVVDAGVFYNSTTKTLTAWLSYKVLQVKQATYSRNASYNMSYDNIDLTKFLPEWVSVGFSASLPTGSTERHTITSWLFNSSYGILRDSPSDSASRPSPSSSGSGGSPSTTTGHKKKQAVVAVVVAVAVGIGSLTFGVGFFLCIRIGRNRKNKKDNDPNQAGSPKGAADVGRTAIGGNVEVGCGRDNNIGNTNITIHQNGSGGEAPTGGTEGLLKGILEDPKALIPAV